MAPVLPFDEGGYRFIKGVFPYSAGVAADRGFEIERVRFDAPVPIEEGFRRIKAHLASVGRPPAAFCACELRSPKPFTEDGFAQFNRVYVSTLEAWGIVRDGVNPVARSNVCPVDPPAVPSFHAFSYTVPGEGGGFVVAGSGEAPEGQSNYRDHIVRRGDVSPQAMREKAAWVLGEQERRLRALGWGVEGRDGGPALHRPRRVSLDRRGADGPGRHGGRAHLAPRATAGRGDRVRDGLSGRGHRADSARIESFFNRVCSIEGGAPPLGRNL